MLKIFHSAALLLDEVDIVLHPLKSELNWPIGVKLEGAGFGGHSREPMILKGMSAGQPVGFVPSGFGGLPDRLPSSVDRRVTSGCLPTAWQIHTTR